MTYNERFELKAVLRRRIGPEGRPLTRDEHDAGVPTSVVRLVWVYGTTNHTELYLVRGEFETMAEARAQEGAPKKIVVLICDDQVQT